MNRIDKMSNVDLTALTHSFQDACADENFKNFVYGLNIKEEELMRHTSSLEDAFKECTNCHNCNSISSCKNEIKGYVYTPHERNKEVEFSYDMCKYKHKLEEENKYKNNLDIYDMNQDIKNASFKDIYKDDKARLPIIKFFKEFMESYGINDNVKGLYLHGSFGSGKTYLIASLFNEMAKKGVKSILIYYPEFLRKLKSSFQTNYNDQFENIKQIPLLLLDDLGAENCSNWSRDEVLGPILQYRMENHLATFFTSNLTLDELEKSLSITSSGVDKLKARRIIERIKQLTISQELISKNRRD